MVENLVIVESPAKAKTIGKILGDNYTVCSSFGHIRDLSKKNLGIDIEHGFIPEYEISPDKKKVVASLKDAAGTASTVWLASDEDREGEAIAWHLQEVLKLPKEKTRRIVFHEITKDAILNAVKSPRDVDMNLVMAQQARRVIDRLVGFELSPILWKKIKPSLSAGRVQSVALRLVVEREREITAFRPGRYYRIEGLFSPEGKADVTVKGILDTKFETAEEVMDFLGKCRDSAFSIVSADKKEVMRSPAPPFTTSSLQQEASRKCGFSVSQTMAVAQRLYESGHITYMRTDSTNLSGLAIGAAKAWIEENYGKEYHKARQYKTRVKGAQEAHEAIRPTFISTVGIQGTAAEKKLYDLIWKRTVASQMAQARLEKTDMEIGGDRISHLFAASGTQVLFDGFLKLYMESSDDDADNDDSALLPPLSVGTGMTRREITATERYTSHPPRYSEAALVKRMEELGIGRPSTYAPIISTLHQRGYIIRQDRKGDSRKVESFKLEGDEITRSCISETFGSEKARLCPEDIGMLVTDFLEKNFPAIMDYGFTAKVEDGFDRIADGKAVWNKLVADFYKPFHDKVLYTVSESEHIKARRVIGTDPASGKVVIARMGRFGSIVQLGEDDDPDKKFAGLDKGQLIESVTLDQALKLFILPRRVGEYNGKEIVASKGKYGPYIKYDSSYISLGKGGDPYGIDLPSAIRLIEEHSARMANHIVREYLDGDLQILNGRFGPYIKYQGHNYKIPKTRKADGLTEQDCMDIIAASRGRKK